MTFTGTTVAGGNAVAPAPASTGAFSVTMPKMRPWLSRAAAPAKPSRGGGSRPSPVRCAGTAVTARSPPCACGSAMPTSVSADAAAPSCTSAAGVSADAPNTRSSVRLL